MKEIYSRTLSLLLVIVPFCFLSVGLADAGSHTLIADSGNHRVIEVDSSGKIVWEHKPTDYHFYPNGVQRLPNGNTLVACLNDESGVKEIDPKGNIVWEYFNSSFPDGYKCAERLSNGNTLITTGYPGHKVIEVDNNGKVVWEYYLWSPATACRLPNGNTLIAGGNGDYVIEVNENGDTIWSFSSGLNYPADAQRLSNGNTLIADMMNYRVIEVDKSGDRVWECSFAYSEGRCQYAERLPNDDTLISIFNQNKVIKVDKSCNVIWEYSTGLNHPRDADRVMSIPLVTPTHPPTAAPTVAPTAAPTAKPTAVPTAAPTAKPTVPPPNSPPSTSGKPSGSSSGYTGTHTYSTYTTDPNGDKVQYRFDWGDGTISSWSSFVNSGASVYESHSWSGAGTYYVRTQARDTQGATSSWSSSKTVSVSTPPTPTPTPPPVEPVRPTPRSTPTPTSKPVATPTPPPVLPISPEYFYIIPIALFLILLPIIFYIRGKRKKPATTPEKPSPPSPEQKEEQIISPTSESITIERAIYDPCKRDFIERALPRMKEWINRYDPGAYWFAVSIQNNTNETIEEWDVDLEFSSALKIIEAKIEGIEIEIPHEAHLGLFKISVPQEYGIVIPKGGAQRVYFKLRAEKPKTTYEISGVFKSAITGDVPIRAKEFKYLCDAGVPPEAVKTELKKTFSEKDAARLALSFKTVQKLDRMCNQDAKTEEYLDKLSVLKNYTEGFSDNFSMHVNEFSRFMKEEQMGYLDDKYKGKVRRFCTSLVDVWISEFLKS